MDKGYEQSVLDHGYVKFIDYMGTDESIIEAARMSTNKGFEGWDKDQPLLEFLYANTHATPFEMCELVVEVQAPLMVFREWHRHRTQSYNEMSARYIQMPNLHYVPSLERIKKQSLLNKQASADQGFDEEFQTIVINNLREEQDEIYISYDKLIELGVAKEIARINTPVSRYSRMRAKANLRNWLAFLTLRMAPDAQWEIVQFANAVSEIVKVMWPRTWALFEEYTLYSLRLSRTEAKAVVQLLNQLLLLKEAEQVKTTILGTFTASGLNDKKAFALFNKLNKISMSG